MRLGDVVDQFHDDNGLAHSSSSECPDLSSFDEGANQVDHFDAGFENVGFGVLLEERRSLPVNGSGFLVPAWSQVIYGVTRDVKDTSQHFLADWH